MSQLKHIKTFEWFFVYTQFIQFRAICNSKNAFDYFINSIVLVNISIETIRSNLQSLYYRQITENELFDIYEGIWSDFNSE